MRRMVQVVAIVSAAALAVGAGARQAPAAPDWAGLVRTFDYDA